MRILTLLQCESLFSPFVSSVVGAVRYEWPERLLGGAVALQMNVHYVSHGKPQWFGGQVRYNF